MSHSPWSVDAGAAIAAISCKEPGPVLYSLQAIQDEFGYVPKEAVEIVAKACNVSRAEVHGVLTFYDDLRTVPAPEMSIHLCVAEACQALGSRKLVEEAEEMFRTRLGESGKGVELKATYCLGNCALGPSASVNGRLVGRTTPSVLKELSETKATK